MDKKDLKRTANELKAVFHVGKSGITETFLDTIDKYLTVHEIVKIKVNIATNHDEMEEFANEIATKTKSEIVDLKGYTFVIFREN